MSNKVKIVSYNVRCSWDSQDGFVSRMGMVYDKINKEKPDVIAFQEVTDTILKALERIMPDYIFVGHGRNADYSGEGIYIAINKETMLLVGLDTFWIAPNPYDKLSKFSDQSACPRICVSAKLYHKASKQELQVYDVHLDHEGKLARAEGMNCVLNKIAEQNERVYTPAVVLGDFNERPEGVAIKSCEEWENPKMYDITSDLSGTFHGYGRYIADGLSDIKIDYIYVTEDLKKRLSNVELWTDELNGHWLSDHYPVCSEFSL